MPIICLVPQLNNNCPVQCFLRLLLCAILILVLVYLPMLCFDGDKCTRREGDREFVCHFCTLSNAFARILQKIFNILLSWLPRSEESRAPAHVPAPIKIPEKVKEIPQKVQEIPKKVQQIPRKVQESAKKPKKKICEKLSDLFKKCKKPKDKVSALSPKASPRPGTPTCNQSCSGIKLAKSKSEPKMDKRPSEPSSDLPLSGSCARCTEKETPCPEHCPKAKR